MSFGVLGRARARVRQGRTRRTVSHDDRIRNDRRRVGNGRGDRRIGCRDAGGVSLSLPRRKEMFSIAIGVIEVTTMALQDYAGAAGPAALRLSTGHTTPARRSHPPTYDEWLRCRGAGSRLRSRTDQARSNRSRFITLVHALTKSCTNCGCASSVAYAWESARSWEFAPNTRSTAVAVHFTSSVPRAQPS